MRRFWQTSSDNRGTPENPGLVVTLISFEEWQRKFKDIDPHPNELNSRLWGILYKISENDKENVRSLLDHRQGFIKILEKRMDIILMKFQLR